MACRAREKMAALSSFCHFRGKAGDSAARCRILKDMESLVSSVSMDEAWALSVTPRKERETAMYDTARSYDDLPASVVCPISRQSRKEERANAITHGLGLALSVVGFFVLAMYSLSQKNLTAFVCCGIFSVTMVMTYASSTFYHSATREVWKRRLQVVDHICIYLLIAGSYTPFAVLSLKGSWTWGLLSFAWSFAAIGIALKILIKRRYQLIETLLYLVMGWAGLAIIVPLYWNLPSIGFVLLVAGGLSYSLGVIFYLNDRIPYNHAIWHLFVMGGSACHFFSVLAMVTA